MVVLFDFDDIPLDRVDGLGGRENGGKINGTGADFLLIFKVKEADATTLLTDEGRGVFAADFEPIHIGFAAQILGGGGIEYPVEYAAAFDESDFAVVVMKVELETEMAEAVTDLVEVCANLAAGGGGAVVRLGPERTNDVFGVAEDGFVDDTIEFVAQVEDADVHAGDLQS